MALPLRQRHLVVTLETTQRISAPPDALLWKQKENHSILVKFKRASVDGSVNN